MNMKNEIWTFIPSTNGHYQISNLGRIRKVNYALKNYGIHIYSSFIYEIIEPKLVPRVYLDTIHKVPVVRITLHGMKFQKFPISELMFLSFHGIANIHANEIIHLDGNEENNALDNLILVKPIFKLQYLALAEMEGLKTTDSTVRKIKFIQVKRISKYNRSGELKQVFSSLLQAEKEDGLDRLTLVQSVKARSIQSINDHFYKQGHGPLLLDFSLVLKESVQAANFRARSGKFILQYSKAGVLIAIFRDVQQASQSTQCLKQHILKSIKTRQIVGHFLWVELEDRAIDHSKLGMSLAIGRE